MIFSTHPRETPRLRTGDHADELVLAGLSRRRDGLNDAAAVSGDISVSCSRQAPPQFIAAIAGKRPQGKVGRDYTAEQAYQHARTVGMDLLAVMRAELGSLDRVKRVVKVLGMVNAVPEFQDHPKVINGCSDLFVEVLGGTVGVTSELGCGTCFTITLPGRGAPTDSTHDDRAAVHAA